MAETRRIKVKLCVFGEATTADFDFQTQLSELEVQELRTKASQIKDVTSALMANSWCMMVDIGGGPLSWEEAVAAIRAVAGQLGLTIEGEIYRIWG